MFFLPLPHRPHLFCPPLLPPLGAVVPLGKTEPGKQHPSRAGTDRCGRAGTPWVGLLHCRAVTDYLHIKGHKRVNPEYLYNFAENKQFRYEKVTVICNGYYPVFLVSF